MSITIAFEDSRKDMFMIPMMSLWADIVKIFVHFHFHFSLLAEIGGRNSNHSFILGEFKFTTMERFISYEPSKHGFPVKLSAIRFCSLFSLIGAIVISRQNVRVRGNNVKSEIAHDSAALCVCVWHRK